jgi:hypothetical protein
MKLAMEIGDGIRPRRKTGRLGRLEQRVFRNEII